MKKLFEKQLNDNINKPLTESILEKINHKIYFNGENLEVGDIVLWAILVGDVIENEGECNELPINIINLNERHLNLFESYHPYNDEKYLPSIKLIKKQC